MVDAPVDETLKINQVSRLVLHGYKSIAQCDLSLQPLNILIGANGAGKSNLIGFFRLINRILDEQLQITVAEAGGADAVLHFGRGKTEELKAELYFGHNGYRFTLRPTEYNRMAFAKEALVYLASQNLKDDEWNPASGHTESYIKSQQGKTKIYDYVVPAMRSWRVYHFHDTSKSAWVKRIHNIHDNEYLRDDARNLAAFLLRLKNHHPVHYNRILKTIRLVAPFFGDFHLRPVPENKDTIQLEWTEEGQNGLFTASALSDGTLRFICLATVLLQPKEFMPATILIDEPELGLHPFAINVLAGMMRSAAHDYQLIVSTQSVELVNGFEPQDLVVVDKRNGISTFTRPNAASLSAWLEDYSLGELWNKNLLGGRPGR